LFISERLYPDLYLSHASHATGQSIFALTHN
jgi:hypothetical protein